jgi:ABC-type transport system involved in cytochrome bd biosynthesis fused ATPase/permease subunit
VGDGGRPLSTGEVRRVALARAFLRDAPLAVLDEPTADLDPKSAELVARAVERLLADRTVLLVTHRPDLEALADRVVRLAGGRILKTSASAAA